MGKLKAIRIEVLVLSNGNVATQDLCEYIKEDIEDATESVLAVKVNLIEEKSTEKRDEKAEA